MVTITTTSFKFSVLARDTARLKDIHWMRVLTDEDDRLVVFQPVSGMEKSSGVLKLGTSNKGHKTLTAKSVIRRTPWIWAVASVKAVAARKFELKEYPGPIPSGEGEKPWFIRLMPAFEESVLPSQIGSLGPGVKGIYRYWSGGEVVYIGKGIIRDRYQQESERVSWESPESSTRSSRRTNKLWNGKLGGLIVFGRIMVAICQGTTVSAASDHARRPVPRFHSATGDDASQALLPARKPRNAPRIARNRALSPSWRVDGTEWPHQVPLSAPRPARYSAHCSMRTRRRS